MTLYDMVLKFDNIVMSTITPNSLNYYTLML